MSDIPFKMRVIVLSLDPTLGFMQRLDQLKILKPLLWVEHEVGWDTYDRISIFDVLSMEINV